MGLVLTVKHDEALAIGDDVVITFKTIHRRPINVRIHIEAPRDVKIKRRLAIQEPAAPLAPEPKKPVRRMIMMKASKP